MGDAFPPAQQNLLHLAEHFPIKNSSARAHTHTYHKFQSKQQYFIISFTDPQPPAKEEEEEEEVISMAIVSYLMQFVMTLAVAGDSLTIKFKKMATTHTHTHTHKKKYNINNKKVNEEKK